MRVFLDANVLFSAALDTSGALHAFFSLAGTGVCELVASPYAIDEARRNIGRKQPTNAPALERLIAQITVCREASPDAMQWALSTGLTAKDAPILAAAAQAKTEFLVTGDRADFGFLNKRKLRGVEVLPPRIALERIVAAAGK